MYNNVSIQNGAYGREVYDKDGNYLGFDPKGKEVRLEAIERNIENDKVVWKVSFEFLGKRRRFSFPRGNISDKKFATFLQERGADITSTSFNCFVDSMRYQEDQITSYQNVFHHLGWKKIATDSGGFSYVYRSTKITGNISGKYVGDFVVKPKGSLDLWCEMVRAEVLGRPQLETILLAALSAPIVGIHGLNHTTDNPIYHINYRAGRGKSTACMLAASVSGEPFEGERQEVDENGSTKEYFSIYGTWGSTPKATISSHAGNRGAVVVLNELGKFMGQDMTTVVFNLSEGSDIKRLNTDLQTVVTEGYNTVFISCGEMSLVGRCKSKLEGIKSRVLEMNVAMTDDAEHSRRIKDGCTENNGFAAPMIAKHIIDNGCYQYVQELYRETLGELTLSAPQEIDDRFIEKFPTFLVMAAKMAEKALGLTFDIEGVLKFCYGCVQENCEDDGDVSKSFTEVLECFDVNVDNFFSDVRPDHTPKIVWGRVQHSNKIVGTRQLVKEFFVYPEKLSEMLLSFGYPNPKTQLKLWRDRGALRCEPNHLTTKVKVNPKEDAQRAYVLQVWKDAPTPISSTKNREFLLSEDEEVPTKTEVA